jgi:hypothetical protein
MNKPEKYFKREVPINSKLSESFNLLKLDHKLSEKKNFKLLEVHKAKEILNCLKHYNFLLKSKEILSTQI